ncbi:MAG: hypothetical protein K6B75_01045 [Lachnospiraceae bacterium]|nr:hypothetical protein [Lachnospiraceae bacterium]
MEYSALIAIILIIVAAAGIITVSIIRYNKHLDKVTKGEVRDEHSSIPEPKETVSGLYKAALMVLVILIFLTISGLKETVNSMSSRIASLESAYRTLDSRFAQLSSQMIEETRRISSFDYEITGIHDGIAEVEVQVLLKNYSSETALVFCVGEKNYKMDGNGYGTYTCTLSMDLFEECKDTMVSIMEDGKSENEEVYMSAYLFTDCMNFTDVLPSLEEKKAVGGRKIQGSYDVCNKNSENVDTVTVTYVSGGKDLMTIDVTKQLLNYESIEMDSNFVVEENLSFRVETITNNGYRLVSQFPVFYDVPITENMEYECIYDPQGKLVWGSER